MLAEFPGGQAVSLASEAGIAAQRRGALERAASVLGDWQVLRGELADVSDRMLQALGELGILEVAGSDPRRIGAVSHRDPGRGRRPVPVRHLPRDGQARRPGPVTLPQGILGRGHTASLSKAID